MEYLLFKLNNKEFPYAIVSPKVLYLLNDSEYTILKNVGNQEVLEKAKQIEKEHILNLIAARGKKEIIIQGLNYDEFLKLNFETTSNRKQFIGAFPKFKKEVDGLKTRINPINALLVMLFAYSFIWAGTRPSPADINPEGIRWKIAYLNVKFLEWLNGLIGQKLILGIGIILVATLLYFIFRPELESLFGKQMKYSNTMIKEKIDSNL